MQEEYQSSPRDEYRNSLVQFVTPHFKNGDLALTLTYRAPFNKYSANIKPNYLKCNDDLEHFLRRVDQVFLGSNKARKQRLNAAYAFEQNLSEGVHVHMVLQALPTDRVPLSEHIKTLTNIWVKMESTGLACATKIKEIYDCEGWVSYMFKEANINTFERHDPSYWRLTISE